MSIEFVIIVHLHVHILSIYNNLFLQLKEVWRAQITRKLTMVRNTGIKVK